MIKGKDIYEVLSTIVPLYVPIILAYGSVRWWKIFTPEQCSGINRFVALFAVPFLSFSLISSNDPYTMNFRFLAGDSLQKIVILIALYLWRLFFNGSLEWMITFFSLSTLPNTLVMGIPLLKSMYGDSTSTLMVQIVVLQSVIWYTLMLFMFEFRAAKLLISEQFPETAGSIASIKVESDVVSLNNGWEPNLQADAEIRSDGMLHVVIKRSTSLSSYNKSSGLDSMHSMNSRALNLTGVEIYSVQSSQVGTPRASSPKHGYANSFRGGGGDLYSFQPSKRAGSRNSNFEEELMMRPGKKEGWRNISEKFSLSGLNSSSSTSHPLNSMFSGSASVGGSNRNKELHMFVWSSSNSPISERNHRHGINSTASTDLRELYSSKVVSQQQIWASRGTHDSNEIRTVVNDYGIKINDDSMSPVNELPFLDQKSVASGNIRGGESRLGGGNQMPPASVVTRLILIMVWRKLIRNPNTYASFLGLIWSLIAYRFHFEMPKILRGSITIMSNTGMGMAMFGLGFFMALQPKFIGCGRKLALISMAIRFLVGPAVVMATSVAVGIRGTLLYVSIVQAALPQGLVPFVYAKEYNVHPDILSTAVIFGIIIALPVTIIYYIVLELF